MHPIRLLLLLLLLGLSAPAAVVNLTQNAVNDATGSSLAAVASTQFLESGSSYPTLSAPATFTASSITYRFTHWTVSNAPSNPYRDPWGRSQNPISVPLVEDTIVTAHYLPEKNGTAIRDTDADGLPDWYEIEYFGSLTPTAASDADGDGIALLAEYTSGTHPLFPNTILEGGVAFVDSALVTCNLAGYPSYSLSSLRNNGADSTVPASTTIALPGTLITTPDLSANSAFGFWTLDGVRQADPWGVAYPKITFTTGAAGTPNRIAIAHLFTGDTDSDGIPDAYEQYYFGDLGNGATSDTDGDQVGLLAERTAGTSPVYGNSVLEGGVAWVDSLLQTFNRFGYPRYTLSSIPTGTVNESNVVPPGTVVTTASLTQTTFGYWTLDGTRQADPWGAALRQLSFSMASSDRNAVARFFADDSDSDGVADAWEMYYYGTLDISASSDTDGDGFNLLQEIQAGTSPLFGNSTLLGGVTWVDTELIVANLQPFERITQLPLNGTLTSIFSQDPNVVSGLSVGSSASAAFTDWDGDGDFDLFIAGENTLRVFLNVGTARAMALQEITAGFAPLAAVIAGINRPVLAGGDWNGDGKGDLVVGGDTGTLLLFTSDGTAQGSATRTEFPTGSTKARPALGDMNGDGRMDLLALLADGSVKLWLNSGAPPFFAEPGVPNLLGVLTNDALSVSVGDINQDGIQDVLLSDTAGRVSEFIRASAAGAFTLKSKVWGGTADGFASGLLLATVDLEGDGDLDAVGGLANGGLIALRNPSVGRPSGLITTAGADAVQVRWNANSESRIRGYYIYRADSADGPFNMLQPNLLPLPTAIDKTVSPGIEYRYYVTGVSFFYTPGNSQPRILQSLPSETKGDVPGKLRLSLRPVNVLPGQPLKVDMSLALSTPAISAEGFSIRLLYNPAQLRPVSQTDPSKPTVRTTGITAQLQISDNSNSAQGELIISGSAGMLRPGGGAIFSLNFSLQPNVSLNSTLAISLTDASFTDVLGRTLVTEIEPQELPELRTTHCLGDVDGNGIVDRNDLTQLRFLTRRKARPPTPAEIRAGDLDGNGRLEFQDIQNLEATLAALQGI